MILTSSGGACEASVSKDGCMAWTRGHPSRRAQGRAPQDEVGDIFTTAFAAHDNGDWSLLHARQLRSLFFSCLKRQRRGGGVEPYFGGFVDMRADFVADAGVIVVEADQILCA